MFYAKWNISFILSYNNYFFPNISNTIRFSSSFVFALNSVSHYFMPSFAALTGSGSFGSSKVKWNAKPPI